jgi:CRP-like cAMP-binding protein
MRANELGAYRDVLAGSVVFERLSPADLDLVVSLCRFLEVKEGETLLTEGRPGAGLYIILEGQVEFFLPERGAGGIQRPSRVRLNTLGSGRCFGEYGLIDDKPSSASARALSPTRLCLLPRADFHGLTDGNDRIGKILFGNLLKFLVGRLRAKDKELDAFVVLEPPADPGRS